MSQVRTVTPDDIPGVVALVARVYPEKQHRWPSRAASESYFREMLFDNPWHDLELPSWLAEVDGRITGFYAVLPRRMLLHGRPIRVAVGCQFMVDPQHRNSLTWLQLARACISGPQDLTLADAASGTVIYRSRMHAGLKCNFQLMPGAECSDGIATRRRRHARLLFSRRLIRPRPGQLCKATTTWRLWTK